MFVNALKLGIGVAAGYAVYDAAADKLPAEWPNAARLGIAAAGGALAYVLAGRFLK